MEKEPTKYLLSKIAFEHTKISLLHKTILLRVLFGFAKKDSVVRQSTKSLLKNLLHQNQSRDEPIIMKEIISRAALHRYDGKNKFNQHKIKR